MIIQTWQLKTRTFVPDDLRIMSTHHRCTGLGAGARSDEHRAVVDAAEAVPVHVHTDNK